MAALTSGPAARTMSNRAIPVEVTPMSVGPAEIIVVLLIALLVFGPKRLPQMGRSLGRGVREFRKAAETAKSELGLGEVTEQINEVKSTFTAPLKEVTGSISELKDEVNLKQAIEATPQSSATEAATGGEATTTDGGPAPAGATPTEGEAPGESEAGAADDGGDSADRGEGPAAMSDSADDDDRA